MSGMDFGEELMPVPGIPSNHLIREMKTMFISFGQVKFGYSVCGVF
jgi:hypothetical protein